MLWVSEHGKILRGKRNEMLSDGNLQLKDVDFDAFLALLDDAPDDSPDYEPIFRYSRPYGQHCLTVRNYVGVIAAPSGTQVEILPKISKADDPDSSRELLVKMLMALSDSPFREGTGAELAAHKMPLFEVLMRQFLLRTTDIARKGIARSYQSYRNNLVFLKGKLQLSEHLKLNSVRSDRVYCEYDEYEANRPINRLIKRALDVVIQQTRDAHNHQLCRELLFWFDGVPASQAIDLDLARIQKDRLIQHYQPAMPSCRLILKSLNPLTKQGNRDATSMLFPMETVFENFVAVKLSRQFQNWRVQTQVGGRSLVDRHRERRMFYLRPDLVLRRGSRTVVADTKWKLLNSSDRGNKYGISQADMYQLFAYSRKFLPAASLRETYLIYPKTQRFQVPLRPFWYEADREVLHVVPFDLEAETLVLPESCGLRSERAALAS